MASKIQFKRGTTTQSNAHTGAEAEIIINTTKDTIVVHDGSEQGGFEALRSDLSNLDSAVPADNIGSVDCGLYGSGLFTAGTFSSASLSQTIDNPNDYDTSASDQFGVYSVATSGNYTIVGAKSEDDASDPSTGKAYIFNNSTGALVHTLDNPNAHGTGNSDEFGHSVAISGNYAAVGARGESSAASNTYASGKAYIFNVTTGELLQTLANPNPYGTALEDQFGYKMAMSGDYVIIGAPQEDAAGGTGSGKAYIFNVSTGALVHTLDNPNAAANSYFGWAVAISGNTAIVGAWGASSSSGKAYIFNVSTGALLHTLDNQNAYGTSDGDRFGFAVAISDNYAIVGAHQEDDAGGTGSGKAYIYNNSTGALVHTLDNPNPYGTSQYDSFGYSVAISGITGIVSAYAEGDAGGTRSGKAYIYNVTTGELLETLDNPNAYGTSQDDYFGHSVAISSDYIVAGTFGEDDAGGDRSGKVYIYEVEREAGNEITAPGAPTIGTAASVNASTVAVQFTAPAEDGYATIETYTATSSPGGITGTLSQEGSGTITVTGLTENTSYTFTVTATNSYTTGPASSASNSVVPVPPPLDWDDFSSIATNTETVYIGKSVAIGPNYYATGGESANNTIYVYNNSNGGSRYTISVPVNSSLAPRAGKSMDMYGDYLVVSDYWGKDSSSHDRGRMWVYDLSQSTASNAFVFKKTSPATSSGSFASSVTINSTLIAANDSGTDNISIYNYSGVLQHTLTRSSISATGSGYPYNIKLTEDYLFIGNNGGSVYQVNLSDYSLERTITGSSSGYFSRTMNTSSDGSRLIVSAPYESTPLQASGEMGGKVYVYDTSDGSLVRSFTQPSSSGYKLGMGEAEGNTGGVAVSSSHAFIANRLGSTSVLYAYRLSDGTLEHSFYATNSKHIDSVNVLGTDLVIGSPGSKQTLLYRADDS